MILKVAHLDRNLVNRMAGRSRFYLSLARHDLLRLWRTTQQHVIIVAGICLPVLMLMGLKRGHVETLRRDLVTSVTGRQITFWSARKGELMDRPAVERLEEELPAVDLIVPESERVVRLRAMNRVEASEIEAATIYATRPGDPLLTQFGIKPPVPGSMGIVVSEGVAKQLTVACGETIEVVLTRGRGDQEEAGTAACEIVGILRTDEHNAAIAYVDLDLLDKFDAYIRGLRVPSLGWASAKSSAPDVYASYLIFCESASDLTDSDRQYLMDRGLRLIDRSESPPAPLDLLLTDQARGKLRLYEAHTEKSTRDPGSRLHLAPSELSQSTEADDVVLPWNVPAEAKIAAARWLMIGLSLPSRTWLREYFRDPDLPFNYDADAWQGRTLNEVATSRIDWPLGPEASIPLEVRSGTPTAKEGSDSKEINVVVVPANLLAWIGAHAAELVDYDAEIRMFVAKSQPAIYDRARLYALTIDDVPDVVRALADRHFAILSETGRITEIHRQDKSLQLLVWVVGSGVFLFGIVTVVSVLMDSTDRKRGTIGVLRVMGMSRTGVVVSILARAMAIGATAALLSVACGSGLGAGLAWEPQVNSWWHWKPTLTVQFDTWDLLTVMAGAMLCCGMGAIPPAWKASRLDPFDAIIEGRFH